jgi:hypothetical protein
MRGDLFSSFSFFISDLLKGFVAPLYFFFRNHLKNFGSKRLPAFFSCPEPIVGRFRVGYKITSIRNLSNNKRYSRVPKFFFRCSFVLLSALGANERFRSFINSIGIKVVKHFKFLDHHFFSEQELTKIKREALKLGVAGIITTEKDFVKFERFLHSFSSFSSGPSSFTERHGRQTMAVPIFVFSVGLSFVNRDEEEKFLKSFLS